MTPEEKEIWLSQVRPILKEHLVKTIGYPNCTNQAIMGQVIPMWKVLGDNKLIVEGMTLQMFIHFAQKHYMEAEINRIIGI
ncbi:MAG TPA: hypothetical protein VN855_00460 [Candidatus Acidoferrum sp.]|nr:hypothetical protein [Candidatus Acidoferrum sp.]